jgi:hypothetical protein
MRNMDHPMTIRLQASVQSLVFVIMLAAALFGTAGRFDIIEFWVYIAIVAAVSALSLTILDADLMQERMRPGGRRVGWHFLPLTVLIFVHTLLDQKWSSFSWPRYGRILTRRFVS